MEPDPVEDPAVEEPEVELLEELLPELSLPAAPLAEDDPPVAAPAAAGFLAPERESERESFR